MISATPTSATEVELIWSAPSNDGGSQITSYRIYRDGVVLATIPEGTSYTDATAASGQTYSYQVAAINTEGEGLLSNAIGATTP